MKRRQFLINSAQVLFLLGNTKMLKSQAQADTVMLFLSGDVMTGRGIDQVLPNPGDPRLHEPYVINAQRYVELAEQVNGPIAKPAAFSYIWGDALAELQRLAPDVRIINLETSITTSDDYWPGKGIHYRMHPKNIPCLTAAAIDCCVLANNHVLDWGYAGLTETLQSLREAGLKTAGAGQNAAEANTPAIMKVQGKGRVLVFSFGMESSGIPWQAAATARRAGVNLLADLSEKTLRQITHDVQAVKRSGDIVIASLHWGGNWGYKLPPEHIQFAHRLIDAAGVDVIHGHSSHHPLGIEVYKDKAVIYGCGDLLNDYEGIQGYEAYRDDLALMYFLRITPASGKLVSLEMAPFQIRQFRLNRAKEQDVSWLQAMLSREGARFHTRVKAGKALSLSLEW